MSGMGEVGKNSGGSLVGTLVLVYGVEGNRRLLFHLSKQTEKQKFQIPGKISGTDKMQKTFHYMITFQQLQTIASKRILFPSTDCPVVAHIFTDKIKRIFVDYCLCMIVMTIKGLHL